MIGFLCRAAFAAALVFVLPALVPDASAAPKDSVPFGEYRLRDLSGTGVGPFIPEYVLVDGNGNLNSSSSPLTTGGVTTPVCVSLTVTAGTYATKQPIGGLITFPNAFRSAAGSGILQGISVTTDSVQTAGLRFYPLISAPTNTVFTDHITAAINVADVGLVKTPIDLSSPQSDLGTHTVWGQAGIGLPLAPGVGNTNAYGVLVAQVATAAFATTSNTKICLKILAD